MSTHGFAVEPAWQAIMVDLGVKPADVLRRAALPADLFARVNPRLKMHDFYALWEALEAEVDDPLMPIRLAEVVRAESFHAPLFAALCSPNLLVAVQRIAKYKPLVAEVRLNVVDDAERVAVSFNWPKASPKPPRSYVLTELVFFVALARMATRERIEPLRVVAERPPQQSSDYEDYFGVTVQTGPQSLTFSRADALRPFLTHNEGMWNAFEPGLQRRLSELDESATVADRVHAALLEALPSGATSVDDVATKLAMSRRTLQRRLRDEDTTFQSVLDETREALARHYLSRTTMTSAEISFLLGFEEPNSFSRAFQRWTGETPDTVRRATS